MDAIVRRVMVAAAILLMAVPVWAQTTPNTLQGFSIVLVLGDVQDGATSDNIPGPARAALADLKDFLPYRSYRVLDTAWVLASSATRQAVSSRLQGPDGQDYEVMLDRMPVGASSLQVAFEMREPDGNAERRAAIADREAAVRAEIQQLVSAHAALENQLRRAEAAQNRGDCGRSSSAPCRQRDRARDTSTAGPLRTRRRDTYQHLIQHVARRDRGGRHVAHARRQQGAHRPADRRDAGAKPRE